jgi:hypothetical protein
MQRKVECGKRCLGSRFVLSRIRRMFLALAHRGQQLGRGDGLADVTLRVVSNVDE